MDCRKGSSHECDRVVITENLQYWKYESVTIFILKCKFRPLEYLNDSIVQRFSRWTTTTRRSIPFGINPRSGQFYLNTRQFNQVKSCYTNIVIVIVWIIERMTSNKQVTLWSSGNGAGVGESVTCSLGDAGSNPAWVSF